MWGLNEFKSDLERIQSGNFTDLLVNSRVQPGDEELTFRYHFLKVLSFFKRNELQEATTHSNMYLQSIFDYFEKWNEDYLDPGYPAPPFDFMMLVMMTSTTGGDTFNKFMRLFRHYTRVLDYLNTQVPDREILMTDKTRTDEFLMSCANAINLITSRLNFIGENIISTLHSSNKYPIITSFLKEFMPPDKVNDDETLSCFGRVCLSIGERKTASAYFSKVKNDSLKSINKGYAYYFEGNFAEAIKLFNGENAPPTEGCKLYLGEFTSDISESQPIAKKSSSESMPRWPSSPQLI